jgi:hypothetical protein
MAAAIRMGIFWDCGCGWWRIRLHSILSNRIGVTMPLKYSTPKAMGNRPQVAEVHVERVMINTPSGMMDDGVTRQPANIVISFSAMDADGHDISASVAGFRPRVSVSMDVLAAELGTDFAALYSAIRSYAYGKAESAGFPTGGTLE